MSGNPSLAPSTKIKKKGFGLSFLKRGSSKQDVRDGQCPTCDHVLACLANTSALLYRYSGYASDSASFVDVPPPQSFDNQPLPAKLQARGDAADSMLNRQNFAKGRKDKARKPSTPVKNVLASRDSSTPVARHHSVFTVDPAISLDMNLNSMEGIVNFNALNNNIGAHGSLSNVGGYNNDFASGPDGSAFASTQLDRIAGSRRSSVDPAGSDLEPTSSHAANSRRNNSVGGISSVGSASAGGAHHSVNGSNGAASGMVSSSAGPPMRPGFLRTSSGLSTLQPMTFPKTGADLRRPSAAIASAMGGGLDGAGYTRGGQPGAVASGAWTAPDSWAVKADANAMDDHDSSEEDGEDDHDATEDLESENGFGFTPEHKHVKHFGSGTGLGVFDGGLEHSGMSSARPQTSNGRPGTKGGRPGTADAERPRTSQPKSVSRGVKARELPIFG